MSNRESGRKRPGEVLSAAPAAKLHDQNELPTAIGPILHLTPAEQQVVMIQYRKDNKNTDAQRVLEEYLKYIRIKLSDTDIPFAPSPKVDKMWHAHILSTKEYHQFCERHNGGTYIHHDPTMQQGQERYELTLQVYRRFLGEPDGSIWPKRVEASLLARVKQEEDESKEEAEEKEDYDDDYGEEDEEDDVSVDFNKGATEEERKEYHREYAEKVIDQDRDDYAQCDRHSWEAGEYRDSCRECRLQSSQIDEQKEASWDLMMTRGNTEEERVEYHRQHAMRREAMNEVSPGAFCGCMSGHVWKNREFDSSCWDCRFSSASIDSYTCG